MYHVPSFALSHPQQQLALMRSAPFATLIAQCDGELWVDHLPLLVDQTATGEISLSGHAAKNNPVCNAAQGGAIKVTAIFHGPQHYISPRWYVTKAEGKEAVPTWNYCVVHAHGEMQLTRDDAVLEHLVERLSAHFEADIPGEPWQLAQAPDDFKRGMLKGIVGFHITLSEIIGKAKASQNRSPRDRTSVRQGLRQHGVAESVIAALVREPEAD